MAKINNTGTYPVTTPASGDMLIGTDISNITNSPDGETVNFTIGSILGVTHTHTLANITDSGTMAAQNSTSVSISGGSMSGVSISGGTISAVPTGEFTTSITIGETGSSGQTGSIIVRGGGGFSGGSLVLSDGFDGSGANTNFEIEANNGNFNFNGNSSGTVLKFDGTYWVVSADMKPEGVTSTAVDDGTKTTGTYTPTPVGGNFRRINSNGTYTLAAPTASGDYTMIIQVTNGASANTVTFTGFNKQSGDSLTTTNGDDFLLYITKVNGFLHLHIEAMQ